MKKIILPLIFFLLMVPVAYSQCDTIKEIRVTIISYTKKDKDINVTASIDRKQNMGRKEIAATEGIGKNKTYEVVNIENAEVKLLEKNICFENFTDSAPYLSFSIDKPYPGWAFTYTITIVTSGGKTYLGEHDGKLTFESKETSVRKPLPKLKDVTQTPVTVAKKDSDEVSKFMYLTAADFNFDDNKSGYVGHLNMYRKPYKRFGFNAGLMKINYNNNDSIVANAFNNVKMNPLNNAESDTTYIRQFNQYTRKVKSTAFSIYFQPLVKINSWDKQYYIYAHGHFELLISRFTITTTMKNIAQDTITVTKDNIPAVLSLGSTSKSVTTQQLLNGYFGAGVTFDLSITERSSLFFQPTIGWTTNYPQVSSVNSGNISYIDTSRNWNGFYLIRSYYRNKLEKSEIIIGTDIRGLLPRYEPYYSVYAGINIDVNALADILK